LAHLRIGRLLASETAPDERDEKIFDIVNQLNGGAALIETPEERVQVAEFNLRAGKRAKSAAAYSAALQYFSKGYGLLGKAIDSRGPDWRSTSSSNGPSANI
jgi:predicted ATPase